MTGDGERLIRVPRLVAGSAASVLAAGRLAERLVDQRTLSPGGRGVVVAGDADRCRRPAPFAFHLILLGQVQVTRVTDPVAVGRGLPGVPDVALGVDAEDLQPPVGVVLRRPAWPGCRLLLYSSAQLPIHPLFGAVCQVCQMWPWALIPKTSSRPSALGMTRSDVRASLLVYSSAQLPTHPLFGAVCQVCQMWPWALTPKTSSRPSALRATSSMARLSLLLYSSAQLPAQLPLGVVCQVCQMWPWALTPKTSSRPSALRATSSMARLSLLLYSSAQLPIQLPLGVVCQVCQMWPWALMPKTSSRPSAFGHDPQRREAVGVACTARSSCRSSCRWAWSARCARCGPGH